MTTEITTAPLAGTDDRLVYVEHSSGAFIVFRTDGNDYTTWDMSTNYSALGHDRESDEAAAQDFMAAKSRRDASHNESRAEFVERRTDEAVAAAATDHPDPTHSDEVQRCLAQFTPAAILEAAYEVLTEQAGIDSPLKLDSDSLRVGASVTAHAYESYGVTKGSAMVAKAALADHAANLDVWGEKLGWTKER